MYDRTAAPGRPSRPKSITRALAAASTAAAVLAAGGLAKPEPAAARANKSRLDPTEKRLVRAVNRTRARHGLAAYSRSRALARSADFHSSDMLRGNFFAHSSSNGTSFEGRVRRYSGAARLAENLAWVPGERRGGVVRQVIAMWMGSPSHRAALLEPDFAKIGVARRTGRMGSAKVTVFTANLSTRR